jgi:hypothetical protein
MYACEHDGEWPRSWDALRDFLLEVAAVSGRNEEELIESVQPMPLSIFRPIPV